MSFGLYSTGFAIVIGGLIYAAYLMHIPAHRCPNLLESALQCC